MGGGTIHIFTGTLQMPSVCLIDDIAKWYGHAAAACSVDNIDMRYTWVPLNTNHFLNRTSELQSESDLQDKE